MFLNLQGQFTRTAQAVDMAVDEMKRSGLTGSSTVVVLLTDGNSQDSYQMVSESSQNLRATGAAIFIAT